MHAGRQCNVLILWETALIPSPVFLLKILLAIISTLQLHRCVFGYVYNVQCVY